MPVIPTFPGVYIEEVPSTVRTITGVATSVTGFIGRARRGPTDEVRLIHSFADYERTFGGLWAESSVSYAVLQYFQNGGRDALIVRVHNGAAASTLTFPAEGGGPNIVLAAAYPGSWGAGLRGRVDYSTRATRSGEAANSLFNLAVSDILTGQIETHRNLSIESGHPSFITTVLAEESGLDVAALQQALEDGRSEVMLTETAEEARRLGITSTPTFLFEGRYVAVGAQPTEELLRALNTLSEPSSERDRPTAG